MLLNLLEDENGGVQSLAVRCLGPLVGKDLPKLLEDKDGDVQNLTVRRLGPLVGELLPWLRVGSVGQQGL